MVRRIRDEQVHAADIAPGTCKVIGVGDLSVTVYNVGGTFYATQSACTHAGGPLCEGSMAGEVVMCPWHGSRFNVRTGEVVQDPADKPLTTYPVSIQDGIVVVG